MYLCRPPPTLTGSRFSHRVAICIDEYIELLKRTGEPANARDVQRLQEGAEIVV